MSRPRHRSSIFAFSPRLALLVLVGAALPACDSTTEPDDGALDQLNEMAIHAAILERLTPFNHSVEANVNLGLAFDAPVRALPPFSPALFGETVEYSFDELAWQVAEGRPEVPDDVLRVIWYQVTDESHIEQAERGYVDLTRLPDAEMDRVRVQAVRTATPQAAVTDYVLRFGTTTAGNLQTHRFEVMGSVSDGTKQVGLDQVEIWAEDSTTGTVSSSLELTLSDTGFLYTASLQGTGTTAPLTESAAIVASTTIAGVTTRLDLDVQGTSGQTSSGSGEIFHDGVKLANVAISNNQMTFTRAAGGSFTSNQQRRLETLVAILFNPLTVADQYFR
jgi:hypothetical protein